MPFSQFYQQGGLFMHLISLVAIAIVVSLGRRAAATRRALNDPSAARSLPANVTPSLIASGLMLGVLGTCFGLIEVSAALRTVPPEQWTLAAVRGGAIATFTTAWAMGTMTLATLAHAVLRSFENRVNAGLVRHRSATTPGARGEDGPVPDRARRAPRPSL